MNCPHCKTGMVVIECQSLELDYCPDCLGVWFDRGEIELLAKSCGLDFKMPISNSLRPVALPGVSRKCPLCSKIMHPFSPFGGHVILDGCADCGGLWFDRGEILEALKCGFNGYLDQPVLNALQRFLGSALCAETPG